MGKKKHEYWIQITPIIPCHYVYAFKKSEIIGIISGANWAKIHKPKTCGPFWDTLW
jgi:hypothetical protein